MSSAAAQIRESLDAGLNAEALDRARQAAADEPASAEIRYLGALASARIGATAEAERWLQPIERDGLGNSALAIEVWSLAGRIAKERYALAAARSDESARDFARVAIECYRRAHSLGGSAYPAVNAATMAMLCGDTALARTLAQQALAAMESTGDHWQQASCGEARLLLGDIDAARRHYAEAHRLAGNRFGDIAVMRRQLGLIGSAAAREVMDAVPAPSVVAFSGHMIDHPSRREPRFPARLEANVATALCDELARLGPSIGYAQAACGSDILFLEAMQAAGMQTHVVLPFAPADFVTTSVAFAGGNWRERFDRVLARASRVVLATEEAFLGDEVLFEHAGNLIQGMAFLRARELSTRPVMLTVLDPAASGMAGGTAATVRAWADRGGAVTNIDLAALRGRGSPQRRPDGAPPGASPPAQSASARSLKSLLFADITGFSRLPEQYTPRFVEVFLGTCKRILDSLEHRAVDAHTLGDGLFVVFDLPGHAAEFAVRLQRELRQVDWPAMGLASDTAARVGIHTGPVLRTFDPIMAKPAFYGTHVNRTARLEPIVRPGHIFVTESFAASLGAADDRRFTCHYIGAMSLAKQFGEARLYRLHSSADG